MAAVVIFVMAALTASLAIWLLTYADSRSRRDEVNLRLRAGEESAVATQTTKDPRLRNPVLRWACYVLWRAGSDAEADTVAKVLWILAAMIPVTFLIFGPLRGCMVLGFVLAFGYGILGRQAARRRALIVSQMPGFLEAGLRVLQAGSTLEESLSLAAADSPEPVKTVFQSVGRQVRLGAPLDQVLTDVSEIHGVRYIKVIALAAAINRRYGGSLRNIFRSLIAAIRARDSAARELRALTAETRMSAVVLAIIPALLTTYLFFQNRQFYIDMWNSSGGRIALLIAAGLQIAGVAVIYRMMSATEDSD